jgi:hypothetical protein
MVSSVFVSLQGVVYQLDVALESTETQRRGLIFIYDMSDSKYGNFDYDLSQKILTLLKVMTSIDVLNPPKSKNKSCACPITALLGRGM